MAKAPVGANVSLYYDGLPLDVGDFLVTNTGRFYRMTSVRIQQRGVHQGRQHLRADVVTEEDVEAAVRQDPDVRIRPIAWYPRG